MEFGRMAASPRFNFTISCKGIHETAKQPQGY